MKNRYLSALISSSLSIVPMILIIFILSWTGVYELPTRGVILLLIGLVVLIVGLALFQIGAATGLTKVGEYMGSSLSRQKELFIVILFAFTLGALITCAEPSILIVSKQVTIIPNNATMNTVILIGSIAVGVGIFVVIGILRIFYHKSLKVWYLLFYMITFMTLCLICMDKERSKLLPFIFDSGGVTTGSATVPFILALGAGVATVRGGKNATQDSFGLVGMASIGPILTMAIVILINSNVPPYAIDKVVDLTTINIFTQFLNALTPLGGSLGSMVEVAIALTPILVIFFIYNFIFLKLPKAKIAKLLIGFAFTFVGLSLFLSATTAVMSPMGNYVGRNLGKLEDGMIILICFIIGLVIILCEPAVHVLTGQMVSISSGRIKKTTVLLTLSLGVGAAIGLAGIRAIYKFSIMYYMIPGYIISLCLMFVCPDIYTAMAFDSGGTASGPMATSFVLPMIIGIVISRNPDNAADLIYENGFGVVALIALTPVIAIQILGVLTRIDEMKKLAFMRRQIIDANDAEIIHF